MVMEGLGALVGRARGALNAALAHRSRPADKSETTPPAGTKPAHPCTPDGSSTQAPTSKSEPRPPTHEETSMRGLYEGVPMQEYLAPNPHTVGVPIPEVHHPANPRRPPFHPRPGSQDRIGVPQQRFPRNPSTQSVNTFPTRPTSAHPRNRDYYGGSDRHLPQGNSVGDRLHQEYSNQIVTSPSARPTSRVSRSTESFQSDHSLHSERRSRSDRRLADEGRGTRTSHRRSRHSPEGRPRRRRSSSPPRRRSRSRESERGRRLSGQSGRSHGSRDLLVTSPPSVVVGGGSGTIPSVYTISGRERSSELLYHQQQQQLHQLQPQQPVQCHVATQVQESPEPLSWREALMQAVTTRDIKAIKPLLPTAEEAFFALGQPQVIALVCGIITAFLMVLALSSSDWLLAVGWRQGLFAHCVGDGAPKPLPFQINADVGCHTARDEPYIMASAALCVICLLLDVFATLMTGLGLSSNDPNVKSRYYRIAVWVMTVALIAILIALILYPVFFAQELELGNRTLWEFGWAYGVGWGAAIFLFGAVVLLLCDQEEEEIYYKERTIIHAENDSRA